MLGCYDDEYDDDMSECGHCGGEMREVERPWGVVLICSCGANMPIPDDDEDEDEGFVEDWYDEDDEDWEDDWEEDMDDDDMAEAA